MAEKAIPKQAYIDAEHISAFTQFSNALYALLNKALNEGYRNIVYLCIGTDRSTGDSLGPLTGYKIRTMRFPNVFVLGDLESPVHARNLDEAMDRIYCSYDRPYVVAVDACLGTKEHVGFITVGEGALKPGAGVNKNLPAVGDIHITGIVNFGGFMDFMVLQNTRLNTVMKMVDIISGGIKYVSWKLTEEHRRQWGWGIQ